MHAEYIEQRDGGYYVAGTGISLDSVVYAFREGHSPNAIQEDFPALKPSQIYGAIAFYLDNQTEIDCYLEETEGDFEAAGSPMAQANPVLWEKIQRAKVKLSDSRS